MELKKADEEVPGLESYFATEGNKGIFISNSVYEHKKLFSRKKYLETTVCFSEGVRCGEFQFDKGTFPKFEGIAGVYSNKEFKNLYKTEVVIMDNDFDTTSPYFEKFDQTLIKSYEELFNRYIPILNQLPKEIKENIGIK